MKKMNIWKGVIFVMASHRGMKTIYAGTIDLLIEYVFGYTLECGHSWNEKINPKPRTKKGLVKALNDSAYECRCYSDYYELSDKDAFLAAGGTIDSDKGYGSVYVKE